jgi:cytochrome b subunit of formate dehydrogenase
LNRNSIIFCILAILSLILIVSPIMAQSNEDCIMCHSDPGLTMMKHGKEVSLFVDETGFLRSTHAAFSCVDCHAGFDPFELPHTDPIEQVDCQMCHDVSDLKQSIHFKVLQQGTANAPQCYDCHTKHEIKPALEQRNDVASCLSCHSSHDILSFQRSAHATTKQDGSLNASCVDCHGGHDILLTSEPQAKVSRDNVQATCGRCHAEVKKIEESSIHGQYFLTGSKAAPSCIDCHIGHNVSMNRFVREEQTCLQCHLSGEFASEFGPRSREFMDQYEHSIHYLASEEGKTSASCSDCHGSHDVFPAEDVRSTVHRSRIGGTCAQCHGLVFAEFRRSVHGDALAKGVLFAPNCTDCHGEHSITAITRDDSPVSRKREAQTCLECHLDDPEVRSRIPVSAGFIASYTESIHGMALQAGNINAATCSDCHGDHEILDPNHPNSMIHRRNVANTCGTCHTDAHEEYMQSSHGIGLERGMRGVPTCTDCHGEHTIQKHDDPRSPVSAIRLATDVCAPCHDSVRLTERYGLATQRISSFVDSYHGLAIRAGGVNVANCASCHGSHNILPSTDPRSTVHPDNLVQTCGSCHPGATDNFARGKVHIVGTVKEDPWIYWISSIYVVLIVSVAGGMFVHNALDFYRKSKNKLLDRRYGIEHEPLGRGLYVRMTLSERLQHGSLMISFPLLVITGFMLSYPDAWWVIPFRDYVPWFYDLRSLIHRIAAVLMIVGSVYHIYYVIFTPRGRRLIKDLMPRIQDIWDAIDVLKFNFGFSNKKPQFGRFGYVEKAEYWALLWGTAVMVLTGFVLWFETTFINLTSLLFHDISRTIHFYEAWLAMLSIIIWHLYFVIFNPDVYPMNLAWLKGTITEEEMMHEHPLELEQIKRERAEKGEPTEFISIGKQEDHEAGQQVNVTNKKKE